MNSVTRWLRRGLCIYGGAVSLVLIVLIYVSVAYRLPKDSEHFLAIAWPSAGVIGAALGAWIVFRDEKKSHSSDGKAESKDAPSPTR